MSMEHTQGKLVLRVDGRPELRNQCEILESEDGKHLVVYFKFKNREDARRLVACWNACEGVSTETLEDVSSSERELLHHYVALKAQRDELVAALTDVIGWVPGNWHTDEPRKAVARARALIQKHKGAAA